MRGEYPFEAQRAEVEGRRHLALLELELECHNAAMPQYEMRCT
jgi:hypothetical protein